MILLYVLGLVLGDVKVIENFHDEYSVHVLINDTEHRNPRGTGHFCAFDADTVSYLFAQKVNLTDFLLLEKLHCLRGMDISGKD